MNMKNFRASFAAVEDNEDLKSQYRSLNDYRSPTKPDGAKLKTSHFPFLTDRSTKGSTLENEQIQNLQDKIKSLERTIIIQQKEIIRLKQMNEYLLLSNQSKLDLLNNERKAMVSNMNSQPQSQVHLPTRRTQTDISLQTKKAQVIHLFAQEDKPHSPLKPQSPKKPTVILKREGNQSYRKPSYRKTYAKSIQYIGWEDEQSPAQRSENSVRDRQNKDNQNQFFSFLQVEECFKISAILNMQLSTFQQIQSEDSEAVNLYENDGTLMLMDQLLQEEEVFQDLIMHANVQKISFLYDKLNRVLQEHKQMFSLILRLKKIIQVQL